MTTPSRRAALEEAGLLHPNPGAVSAEFFDGRNSFFLAEDKVQVKYEMLRAHVVDGASATVLPRPTGTRGRRSIWWSPLSRIPG